MKDENKIFIVLAVLGVLFLISFLAFIISSKGYDTAIYSMIKNSEKKTISVEGFRGLTRGQQKEIIASGWRVENSE